MKSSFSHFLKLLTMTSVVASLLLAGCSPSVNMSEYQTYDFFSQMGVEGESYSNLVGQHFRDAISTQMESRGYQKSETPQLQINVSIGAEE
jgi:uncharacterized lipoprotein YajG